MLITENQVRAAADRADSQPINESVIEKSMHFDQSDSYDLFISHSYLDRTYIRGLYQLFIEAGYHVYIDWIEDHQLDRSSVNAGTAAIIRKRMSRCKGTAYVATSNSAKSRWCPWELGLGDGMHKGKVCILPIVESSYSTFKGQEYLGLYPYLDYALSQSSGEMQFWVNDQNDKDLYTNLRDWLNNGQLKSHTR